MSSLKKISVILPSYNEKANVIPLIAAIHRALDDRDHEILLVDDNSPDGTHAAVEALRDPQVTAILRTEDCGFANSIRCGLERATGDVFVIMDSDFNHQPEYLPFMVDALAYYDVVSGSRFVYGGKMDTRSRHLLSWAFNIFTRVVTDGQITDNLYGLVAIKREVIERCNYDDIFWGYGDYCIRLMFYLQRHDAKILQFPAVNGARLAGKGNSRFLRVFWQYFTELMALTYRERLRGNDANPR
ncbi:MAG TPA: glycosyltransferase [Kofleriaceae bacterium]|jgi:dolichol-phosphate mannosyltransferase